MKFIFFFFALLFCSCKTQVSEIEIFFIDPASNEEITETMFEIRPYIYWTPTYVDQDGGSFFLSELTDTKKLYNWFSSKLVIQNNSDYDIVINKVEDIITYYGVSEGATVGQSQAESGCNYESETCQMCYPRDIPAHSEVPLEFRGASCRYFSAVEEAIYKAARLTYRIEFISEVYGTMSKEITLFARPRSDFSTTESYGMLFCSDGTAICKSSWEWDRDDLPTEECNCDGGSICDGICETESEE